MWPEDFKATFIGNTKYFRIDYSFLLALGLKTHVKKKGYKHLDTVLEKHGEITSFCAHCDKTLIFKCLLMIYCMFLCVKICKEDKNFWMKINSIFFITCHQLILTL